jgi:ABC-2 type transport system permease protein
MSAALLKLNIKNNAILLLIFCSVMCMYLAEIMYMFDPNSSKAMMDMLDMLPSELISAFGYNNISSDLTGFVAGFYYGFLVFAFPMVYYIILSNRLVCKMVDSGAFCYLLQTPTSRKKIIVTQAVYLLGSIAVLFSVVYLVGVNFAGTLFPCLLNVPAYTKLHTSAALMTMAMAMVCFFYSCLFNETKYSLAFGTGIPLIFLLLQMIGGVSVDAEVFKDMSIFSILDATAIVQNGSTTGINILFFAMIVILFAASVLVFDKKRLPL